MGRAALIAFLALGLVSLFADMTYEGARSIIGPYLDLLEASSVVAGLVAIGDLIGYLARGLGGFLAGRSRSSSFYWGLIFLGYGINLFAVPALALAGNWEIAFILVLIERIGKGLRAPARDTVLAEITEGIGKGKGFGLHEVMDQTGAILGPAIVGYALYQGIGYSGSFKVLLIPALFAMAMLMIAFLNHREVHSISSKEEGKHEKLPTQFWIYSASMALLALGFIHWVLAGYHIKNLGLLPDSEIPFIYMVAMITDAIIALPAGFLYDKWGPKTLLVTPFLAMLAIYYLMMGAERMYIYIGAVIWGILMGLYETNMRVTVADAVTPQNRAYAYGIYGVVFGTSWVVGNGIMGALYPISVTYILIFVIGVEIVSLGMLGVFLKRFRKMR